MFTQTLVSGLPQSRREKYDKLSIMARNKIEKDTEKQAARYKKNNLLKEILSILDNAS